MATNSLFPSVAAATLASPSACVGMARFILGQTDSRECVPFLISGDNVV